MKNKDVATITINLNLLEYSWTAVVTQQNGIDVTIWYTAWTMTKQIVKDIVSVASDYPKHKI